MPAIHNKIKCPRHYTLKPGHDAFIMEVDPMLKNVSQDAVITFGVQKMRPKKDRQGNKIVNYNNFYQPEMSAAFAIEHIYDPLNPVCKLQCRGRCLEGKGKVNTKTIKRLNG